MHRSALYLVIFSLVASPCVGEDLFDKPNSPYRLRSQPERARNYFFPPLCTLLVPGLDQVFEEQYLPAAIYAGTGIGGLAYGVSRVGGLGDEGLMSRDSRGELLAAQLYQTSGFLSSYHSFRTAVRSQKPHGKFSFLTMEETPAELLTAPFHFEYLARWTTLVPMATVLALVFALPSDGFQGFGFGDAFYAVGFSYQAGVGEEAAFRGFLMPATAELTGSPLVGNLASGTLFALLHTTNPKQLWHHLIWAWYIGYVSQKRDWTISEAIFIHTWWDIIIFSAAFATQKRDVPVQLPILNLRF